MWNKKDGFSSLLIHVFKRNACYLHIRALSLVNGSVNCKPVSSLVNFTGVCLTKTKLLVANMAALTSLLATNCQTQQPVGELFALFCSHTPSARLIQFADWTYFCPHGSSWRQNSLRSSSHEKVGNRWQMSLSLFHNSHKWEALLWEFVMSAEPELKSRWDQYEHWNRDHTGLSLVIFSRW